MRKEIEIRLNSRFLIYNGAIISIAAQGAATLLGDRASSFPVFVLAILIPIVLSLVNVILLDNQLRIMTIANYITENLRPYILADCNETHFLRWEDYRGSQSISLPSFMRSDKINLVFTWVLSFASICTAAFLTWQLSLPRPNWLLICLGFIIFICTYYIFKRYDKEFEVLREIRKRAFTKQDKMFNTVKI